MTLSLSEKEEKLFRVLAAAAAESRVPAYVIGGFVRDKFLGRRTKDIDVVCIGDGIALAQAVAGKFASRPEVRFFKNFGTAQIKTEGVEIEFVGARKESYNPDSRKPNVLPGTLEDDQNRRDFTINALAFSLNEEDYGAILDPFDGLLDLEDKIIRTPLQPEQTFSDDPLRMLRAIRFAAQLDFRIELHCLEGISSQKDRLQIVSRERVADELNKIMMTPKPSTGFLLLKKTGLLDLLLPQLTALSGVEYVDNKGHKDNFYHSLQVLDNIAPNTQNLWLRWAALLHDIGKARAKKYEKGHGWTFHGHEVLSAKMVPKIFSHLKLPTGDKMDYVRKIISLHHRPISLTKENITDSALRRLLFDAGEELEDLMILCKADITSKNQEKKKRFQANFNMVQQRLAEVEEKDRIRNWQPPVSGHEIMETFGLTPSKEVGLIKTAIREAILDGIIPNEHAAAHQFMIEQAAALGITPKNTAS
ncbi:MAG TPA: HD domain-containing protein [Edaphocola sp.]|nr:HD domain-containing protein [Edaphocola sp.]